MKDTTEAMEDADKLFNYVLVKTRSPQLTQSICTALLSDVASKDLVKLKTQADKLIMLRTTMKKV